MKKKLIKVVAIVVAFSLSIGGWPIAKKNVVNAATTEARNPQKKNSVFAGGDGSEKNPYQISSGEMFRKMAEYPDGNFVLISDLDLSDSPRINYFNGSFDGNGHTITVNFSEINGMFVSLGDDAIVTDCNIDIGNNVSKTFDVINYGSVAITNSGLIKKCIVSGSVIYTELYGAMDIGMIIGGICSRNYGNIEICRSDVDFSYNYAPGSSLNLSGISNGGSITKCLNTGNIKANITGGSHTCSFLSTFYSVAGIGCANYGSNIIECGNTGCIDYEYYSNIPGSGGARTQAGFITSNELPRSCTWSVPSVLNSIDSCYVADTCKLSFQTYNVGDGGGVNSHKTTLYADDVKGAQIRTEDEILAWWNSIYTEDDDPEINDKAILNLDDSYGVIGNTEYVTGNYRAKNSENIIEELESINWILEDPSIADLGKFTYIISEDKEEASFSLEYFPQKPGQTVITAELSENIGDNVSTEVVVEPDIILPQNNSAFINDYDTNIVINGSDYLTIKVQLDEADPEYLESFIESFRVNIETEPNSSSNEIINLEDQGYIISEDGCTGEKFITLKIADETAVDNVITISTKVQQKTIRVMYNDPLIDTDLDGIPDIWEEEGLDTDKDGEVDLDLPAMGAVVGHKDIFVEVDIMDDINMPSSIIQKGLNTVAEEFKNHGYYLHIDAGCDSVDFVTGEKWGDLSESESIPHKKDTHLYTSYYENDKWLFTDYTDWDRLTNRYLSKERRAVFRHCMILDLYNNSDSSGVTNPDQSFAIAMGPKLRKSGMGDWYFKYYNSSQIADITNYFTGTFMHELGHSLGLSHGGTDNVNNKPNNLSIMNYSYQTTGLYDTGRFTYSEYELPSLDENNINETKGIDPDGVITDPDIVIKWKLKGDTDFRTAKIGDGKGIDFNGNGVLEESVKIDLYHDSEEESNPKYIKNTGSINEWEKLILKTGSIGDLGMTLPTLEIKTDQNVKQEEEISVSEAIKQGYMDPLENSESHVLIKKGFKEASCTSNGNIEYYKCEDCGKIFKDKEGMIEVNEEDVVIPATGHNYSDPVFAWADEYTSATLTFTCEQCGDEKVMECTTDSSITAPTCTEAGKITYTASVIFNGKDYSDVQTMEGDPATGHNYGYTDNSDGTHTKICSVCGDTITEPHTYQDGFCSFCGAEESADHTHVYGTPKFIWSEDYSSCSVVFTCTDGDDQQTVNCAISAKDNGDGTVTYTATAEFNGETYSDSKQIKASDQTDVTDQGNEEPASGDPISGNGNAPGTGSSSNTLSAENSAKTGDMSHAGLWFILVSVGVGVACLTIYRRKRTI